MTDRLPSLELLLDLVQRERDKQVTHLDALDNKAGIVLGFAGLLITLAPDVPVGFQLVGVIAGARFPPRAWPFGWSSLAHRSGSQLVEAG